MPRETNFFEEAYELCSHREPIIARTAQSLYETMRCRHVETGDEPRWQFNMHFFFLSVAHVIASYAESSTAVKAISQEGYAPIKVRDALSEVELSKLDDSYMSKAQMLQSYSVWVKQQSRDDGDDYDLAYAMRTACQAINSKRYRTIVGHTDSQEPSNEMGDSDFDYWLSGFNNPQ